jgi:phosphohistidine swiveling domain-containing protein
MHVEVSGTCDGADVRIRAELRRRGHRLSEAGSLDVPAAVVRLTSRVITVTQHAELRVELAPVLGRDSAGEARQRFAAPVIVGVRNGPNIVQFVHHDDVARFIADALEHPDWTGEVGLATDPMPLRQVATLLGKPYAQRAGEDQPAIDTTRLSALGFRPGWSAPECVRDFAKANRAHIYLRGKPIRLPWRYPWACVPTRAPAPRYPASEARGEFDTDIDPRWPMYTAVNTTEAFPGPMTPLALQLSLDGMRAMGAHAVEVMGLAGELRRAVVEEQTGAFGHRIYANLSVLFAAGAVLPAAGPAGWRDKLFGAGHGGMESEAERAGLWAKARRLPRLLVFVASSGAETKRMDIDARGRQCGAAHYRDRSDAQLCDELLCLHDEVVDSWATAALITLATVSFTGVLEILARRSLSAEFFGGMDKLASAGLTVATRALAAQAASDPSIAAVLSEHRSDCAIELLRAQHPEFVARLDDVVAAWGHRGPGESELANPVFADDPAVLLEVVGKLAATAQHRIPKPAMSPWVRLLTWVGAWFQQSRERARDAAIRLTHEYRLAAREQGERLVARGVIVDRDDVFYLVLDELLQPPCDVRYLVLRRRVERARLGRERPPLDFVGHWTPSVETVPEIGCGEALSGIPASVGSVTGRVRVVTAESLHQLSPGEILVADSIDVGWTPYFTYAAAVVLSTGARMSHAAIIAREFGIPCVVGSKTASRVLRTGHIVEVDGAAGRIVRVA